MYENMPIGILDIVLRVGLTLATSFLFGIMFLGMDGITPQANVDFDTSGKA